MFKKTVFAAAAVAVTLAATPIATTTAAYAGQPNINFSFGIQTPNGYFSFGTDGGGFQPAPQQMSCWEAKQYLKASFKKVHKVECNGNVYTFEVKKFWAGPWKTVKLNSFNGNYWYA